MVEILALLEILHSLRRDENVLFRETPIRKFWTDTELGQSLIVDHSRAKQQTDWADMRIRSVEGPTARIGRKRVRSMTCRSSFSMLCAD